MEVYSRGGAIMTESLCAAVSKVPLLIPLLGSDKDGEVVAAARAIGRTLRAEGRDFHDLARALERNSTDNQQNGGVPHRDWRAELKFCAQNLRHLNGRERDFIVSLSESVHWREPSQKQTSWLGDIAEKLRRSAA
jgi:hypothetical protein